ncbi:MAG: RNA degradosome polyphosphate kinase, partial [Gammaproteobacteria bacterium]|nr:RNA degradosome polyphosphate kinase [Gammaproteobacteria bacterium]
LTSLTASENLERLITAPFHLFETLIEKIDREIAHAKAGNEARIVAKINALIEPQVIGALYRASAAGVQIDLVVRGMCSLRPGVPGLSDNIRVRSIIGRFLEHSRVYYFRNGGRDEYFCSSADWMDRNFFRRTETCFPINQRKLKDRLRDDLDLLLADNVQAWELRGDGGYVRVSPGDATPIAAQQAFLASLAAAT